MKIFLACLCTIGLLIASLHELNGAINHPIVPTQLAILTNLPALDPLPTRQMAAQKFVEKPVVTQTPLPGTPPTPTTLSASLIRYGNYLLPGFPYDPPQFVEANFLARNKLYVDSNRIITANPIGQYKFLPRNGARQVIWIADVLIGNGVQFTVDGFPWGVNSDENHPPQSLTIQGVPGKVFVSSDQNFGGYTLTIRK